MASLTPVDYDPFAAQAPRAAGGGLQYAPAIASVESGGRYNALGPVTRTGDRAYGKYQVMGANIPEWTREALGRSMTAEEFLADADAQDKVFDSKFGGYAKKYGPEGAARAWFAGEGGMNDPGRKDILGTSVADYGRKFTGALGYAGETPPQFPPASPARAPVLTPAEPPKQPTLTLVEGDPFAAAKPPVSGGPALNTKTDEGGGILRSIDSAVRGAADAVTFGLADEFAAGMGAITGVGGTFGDYSGNLARQRGIDVKRRENDPVSSIAGQVAGGVAQGVAMAPVAAASLGGRALQGAKFGGLTGAAYGFGSGEGGVENRATNALTGAAVGTALGGALPVVTKGISTGYNALMDSTVRPAANALRSTVNPTGNALSLTQRALARDGLTPEQAAGKMRDAIAAGDDSTMLMDVAGDNTRRLGRFATNIPGEGSSTIKDKIFERQLAQPDRVTSAVRKGLNDPDEFYQTLDDLAASRDAYAKPMYDKALSRPTVWNDRMQEFIDDPAFKKGLTQGIKIQRLESLAKGEKFDPKDYAITGFNEAGDPIISGVPNMRTMNVIKKGFDVELGGMKNPITGKLTEEGRALDMVRREFLKELDSSNPDYKAARQVYSSHIDAQFAVEKGKDLLKGDAETARRMFNAMSDSDKEFARIGVAKSIIEDVAKTKDGLDTTRKIFGSAKQREIIKAVFPSDEAYNSFRSTMERETQKSRTKTAIQGNSTTAQQLTDIADNQVDMGVVGNLLAGRPLAAVGAAVQKAMSRAVVVNEGTAKEIADILTTTDPQVAQQVLGRMQQLALKDKRVADNLAKVQQAMRAGTTTNATQQITEGVREPTKLYVTAD